MMIFALLPMLSLTTAIPIVVNQYRGYHSIPMMKAWEQVDRSDNQALATENQRYGVEDSEENYEYSQDQSAKDSLSSSGSGFDNSHNDYSSFDDFAKLHSVEESSNGESFGHHADGYGYSIPVSQHVEVTKPIAVPVYKNIGVPVVQPVKINVPHPVAIAVSQPYPVAVPVSKPFPIQIVRTVAVPVEKKVPYSVEKHIPVPVEKPVPITIEKHIPVPVFKPYPVKIPVYKTIYHHSKSH